jgi:hypothetical protein
MASNRSKQTWIAIAVAVVAILILMGLALAGGSAYFVARHVHAQFVSSESANEQLARGRARFAGQTPLIEISEDDEPVVHHPPADARPAPISVVHAMVYSEASGKLVTVNVPMWLLRMLPAHERFAFLDDRGDWKRGTAPFSDRDRARLTLEDVDRHGAGLILDGRSRGGAQVLVWAE